MTPPRSTAIALVAALSCCAPSFTVHAAGTATPATKPAAPATPKPTKSGHITANGVDYYYALYGKGEPLLLLHGGLGQIEMFGTNLGALAAKRSVIGVDLQGHGRSSLGERDIDPVAMGDDMDVILEQLGQKQVDVLGYSMGAAVALRFAVQHPDRVRRLVLVSCGFAQDGFYPEMLPQQAQVGAAMADAMKDTPMYKSYMAVAPHPEDFPRLLDRMGAWMRKPYDWSEDVKKLAMPVMLIYGDSDMFRPEHEVKFYQLLGGGLKDAGWQRENMSKNRLAILPNLTHYEMSVSPALAPTALPFLSGETAAKSWSQQVAGEK